VRTYAPIGQTPILREWHTRDYLSAISAISPEGKLYFHSQDHAMTSADVVAFLERLLREVPGRIVILWDGAPIHRSHLMHEFLANSAAQRLHLERLPHLCPRAEPGEGPLATAQRGGAAQSMLLQPPTPTRRAAPRGETGPAKTTPDHKLLSRRQTLDRYDGSVGSPERTASAFW
jgi:DDE superfamily endonuclease